MLLGKLAELKVSDPETSLSLTITSCGFTSFINGSYWSFSHLSSSILQPSLFRLVITQSLDFQIGLQLKALNSRGGILLNAGLEEFDLCATQHSLIQPMWHSLLETCSLSRENTKLLSQSSDSLSSTGSSSMTWRSSCLFLFQGLVNILLLSYTICSDQFSS